MLGQTMRWPASKVWIDALSKSLEQAYDDGDFGGSVGDDHIDALTEIAQGIKTAANDTSALVVGTAGSTDDCAKWDANGPQMW